MIEDDAPSAAPEAPPQKPEMIGGKFKSVEELLKSYQQLERLFQQDRQKASRLRKLIEVVPNKEDEIKRSWPVIKALNRELMRAPPPTTKPNPTNNIEKKNQNVRD